MLETLKKLFGETLGLTAEYWTIVLIAVPVLAFIVTLAIGLTCGKFKKIKSVMRMAANNPVASVAAMKQMPASVKILYKNARVAGAKPSAVVTESVCVIEPYRASLVSKIWLVTLIATLVCSALAFTVTPIAVAPKKVDSDAAAQAILMAPYLAASTVLVAGGLFTLIGAIIGMCARNSAAKLYEKFIPALDGDYKTNGEEQAQAYSEPQPAYAEPQQDYAEPQQVYAEPQQDYAEPQQVYAEPQQEYAEPQQVYAEPQQVYAESQQTVAAEPVMSGNAESDEDIRRKAREEAIARARQEQAQAQARAQAQQAPQTQQAAQQPAGSSTVDDVIAQIEKIDRDGAPRETMREVATLLQKERNKPENKTPEQQRRLNEALTKLLRAMTAASRK